jgi:hypothetical protein
MRAAQRIDTGHTTAQDAGPFARGPPTLDFFARSTSLGTPGTSRQAMNCRSGNWEVDMIVVRTVLQAKFGTGGRLAASFSETSRSMMAEMGTKRRWRVLSDLSGPFDTIVQEVEAESLAEWETMRTKLFESKAFRDSMAVMQEMVVTGRNELWTVEGEG